MHAASYPDLICLSHLRWGFVFQRPQHLMTRFGRDRRVTFVEEPVLDARTPELAVTHRDGVDVAVPHLPESRSPEQQTSDVRDLLLRYLPRQPRRPPVAWFYTPMAVPLVDGLTFSATVFDCMDELSAFAHAPASLRERERELLARADLVFTGGQSLFEAKRGLHPNVHLFPSSVDVAHFAGARRQSCPADQVDVPTPRIGFCGVIDERMDRELVRAIAALRPQWQFVMLGPTAKLDPSDLPRAHNIHYLGMKSYQELPAYLAGWDVAIMPFAHNESTRFISPTKTPEYLAAGCPVVSTSIRDVVSPYGDEGLVAIADTPEAFVDAIDESLGPIGRRRVDRARTRLSRMSWDRTFEAMRQHVDALTSARVPGPAQAHALTRSVTAPLPVV